MAEGFLDRWPVLLWAIMLVVVAVVAAISSNVSQQVTNTQSGNNQFSIILNESVSVTTNNTYVSLVNKGNNNPAGSNVTVYFFPNRNASTVPSSLYVTNLTQANGLGIAWLFNTTTTCTLATCFPNVTNQTYYVDYDANYYTNAYLAAANGTSGLGNLSAQLPNFGTVVGAMAVVAILLLILGVLIGRRGQE